MGQKSAVAALNDLEILFRYLTVYDVMDKVRTRKIFNKILYKKISFRLRST